MQQVDAKYDVHTIYKGVKHFKVLSEIVGQRLFVLDSSFNWVKINILQLE